MPTFTMRHEIDCTPERFWELVFDKDVQDAVFQALAFPKWDLVEQKETDQEIHRIIRAIPKVDAPAPVRKAIGDKMGYTEDGRFDKAKGVFKFSIKPMALGDKVKNEGTVRCEASGATRCARIVDVVIEAKVFGIGGMIEKMMEKSTREGWAKSADVFNAHLKKQAK